jgi:2-dehydropantoate 2-reductase
VRIAVFGAGALGAYFGARLAHGGAEVSLVARGRHLAALRERGIRVRSVLGDFEVRLPASDDGAAIGPVDVVLFTVKSYDTDAAAARLGPLLRPAARAQEATAVISFQNGIDNEERIAAAIGWEHVVGGVSYVFVNVPEPGVIEHVGGPTSLIFGEFGGAHSGRVVAFLEACHRAGVAAEIADDIRTTLWSKYAFLCSIAGMTAAVRLPIGVIRKDGAARGLLEAVIAEGWRVARAEGVRLPDDYVERQMAFVDALAPDGYASLYHDLVAGRRIELEALHGELVRRAERVGVDVPAARAILAILSPWARRNAAGRGRSPRRPRPAS